MPSVARLAVGRDPFADRRAGPWSTALALLVAGCTSGSSLIEGTVTVIGPNGGIATSADSLFELRFPPGVITVDTRIEIITDRTLSASGVVSPIYRVQPSTLLFQRPVIASYRAGDASGVIWVGRRALGTVDDAAFVELRTNEVTPDYDRLNHVARGEVDTLSRHDFALAELNEIGRCFGAVCGTPCGGCSAAQRGCMPDPSGNVCDFSGRCAPPDASCPTQGWEDAPSTGAAFVVSDIALTGAGIGAHIAEHGNSLVRSSVLGGELLLLAELAGLDYEIRYGEDPHLTLKLYEAIDGDAQFFPANNFEGPDCCQFLIAQRSLDGGQAAVRLPGRLAGGVVENVGTREGPELPFPFFVPGPSMPLENAFFTLTFSSDGNALEGTLGGVLSINSLFRIQNPFCAGESNPLCPTGRVQSTLLDLFTGYLPPDVDVDSDGLERIIIGPDGRAMQCLDGDGTEVPPLVFGAPETCPGRPEMADGYALGYAVRMVPARIIGFQD